MSEEHLHHKTSKWIFILSFCVIFAFIAMILGIIFVPTQNIWTNDAYVTAHYSLIAPRVPGQVISVEVDDNQTVHKGDVLVRLDPRDYQTNLEQMRATESYDEALTRDRYAALERQPSVIAQAQAILEKRNAEYIFAQQNAKRYENLAKTGADSLEKAQENRANLAQVRASVHGAEADLEAAKAELEVLRAKYHAIEKQVLVDKARVKQAELNLSYTEIRAPFDGMVGERSVQAGNYVPDGAALMALVPMNDLWIEANYREIALKNIRPGQKAYIHVDAYNLDLEGVVDSVPPASGAAFAPLAPENATGNFTKIVQRLPVKITLLPHQKLAKLLRMGFSVETTIKTNFDNIKKLQSELKTEESVTAK